MTADWWNIIHYYQIKGWIKHRHQQYNMTVWILLCTSNSPSSSPAKALLLHCHLDPSQLVSRDLPHHEPREGSYLLASYGHHLRRPARDELDWGVPLSVGGAHSQEHSRRFFNWWKSTVLSTVGPTSHYLAGVNYPSGVSHKILLLGIISIVTLQTPQGWHLPLSSAP